MENKYFTPEIEDLRVGYKCEIYRNSNKLIVDKRWEKIIIGFENDNNLSYLKKFISNNKIRVPYLTKEQIETEGWVKQDNKITEKMRASWIPDFTLKQGNITYKLFLREKLIYILKWVTRTGMWEQSGENQIFEGTCKDINTFRYITKLLNIK